MKFNKSIGAFKTAFQMLALIGCFSFLFFSCNKDDGPSTQELLVGDWDLEKFDGDNVRTLDFSLRIEVDADGDYTERWDFDDFGSVTFRGEWKFDDNSIEIEYDDGDDTEFELVELTSNIMVIEDENRIEFEFEKD